MRKKSRPRTFSLAEKVAKSGADAGLECAFLHKIDGSTRRHPTPTPSALGAADRRGWLIDSMRLETVEFDPNEFGRPGEPNRMMKNVLRTSMIAGTAAMACLLLAPAEGQPRAQAYKAPRTADGKPNLNGIWQALNSANWDLQGHTAAPGP